MMQDAKSSPGKPNSVLFSLKELRSVEHQRVQQEKEQQRREDEQRRQAAEEVKQQEKQQVRRREEQKRQAQQQQQQRNERQQQQDRLRLDEAERRARVEAEMQLQLERQRQEVALRAKHGRRAGWIPSALAVVALGALAGYLGHELRGESARAMAASGQLRQVRDHSARLERTAQQSQARFTRQAARYAQRIATLEHALADARRPAAETSRVPAAPVKTRRGGRPPVKKNTKTHFKLCLDSDDPLSCIGKGSPGSR